MLLTSAPKIATKYFLLPVVVIVAMAPTFAFAASNSADLCDSAADGASRVTGVPIDILRTISRLESGRSGKLGLTPWPWAVNQAGQDHWFETKDDAVEFVNSAVEDGNTNIDIGCFQLNYHWHSNRFSSVAEMFDPKANALQAAKFLLELRGEGLDWRHTVAAYHSRNPIPSEAYLARFDDTFALETGEVVQLAKTKSGNLRAENTFPFLVAGLGGRDASLVPLIEGRLRLIGIGSGELK